MRKATVLTWTITLVLLSTGAASAVTPWGAKGSNEPDTLEDVSDGYQWTEPAQTPGEKRVYFNGFGGQYFGYGAGASTSFNPNVAAAQSSVLTYPYQAYAMLGVWTDCNGDGYIGLGDNALLEYRAELLDDTTLCPAEGTKTAEQYKAHNDGLWVREFVPIGYDDVRLQTAANPRNPFNINDTRARVWADWDRPSDAPAGTCPVRPAPYGTFRSTGGVLRYIDCQSGYNILPVASDVFHAIGLDSFAFDDVSKERPDTSGSDLNQPNPWGQESDDSYFVVADCSAEPTDWEVVNPADDDEVNVTAATGQSFPNGDAITVGYAEEGIIANGSINQVMVPTVNPAGSADGSVNETEEAVGSCDRNDDSGTNGELVYTGDGLLEGGNEPTLSVRTLTDQTLFFNEGDRRQSTGQALLGKGLRDGDLGTGTTTSAGLWQGNSITAASRNPYVSKTSLNMAEPTYITYYAYVNPDIASAEGLTFPSQTPGSYGAEGVAAGFVDPNPANWWVDGGGNDVSERTAALGDSDDPADTCNGSVCWSRVVSVRVGQDYQLRDIDCHDTSAGPLRENGIGYSMFTSAGLCPIIN